MPSGGRPGKRPTALCPSCGKVRAVNKDGTFFPHGPFNAQCPGNGKRRGDRGPALAIGNEVTYTDNRGERWTGRLAVVRASGTVMSTPAGDFEGVQFGIDLTTGGRVWTCTFANRQLPIGRS